MAWRNCTASVRLIEEINRRWPNRSRVSDGTIGDAAHATRSSDHNPWLILRGEGIVRARDITADGIDAPWLAEYLRTRGANGDTRLTGGGYIIFNRRITTPTFSGWKAYTGTNPHTQHVHVSFSQLPAGFDSTAAWDLAPIAGTPTPAPRPATEDDDMTPDQAKQLALLTTQLVTGPDPNAWGWPTFPGGSNDRFTVVDYLRKQNQRAEDLAREVGVVRSAVAELSKQVAALPSDADPAGSPAAAGGLSDSDVQRIATAVLTELGLRRVT